ncbi:MAG: leucine-rich repeat domain-containing protein, partial [Paraprevotella sp.]|nr:leucine-rich repeat domain-containing protein [Paraprevotella sp.]
MKNLFKCLFLFVLCAVTAQEVSAWEFDESTGVLRVKSNYNYTSSAFYPWSSFADNIKSVEFTSSVTSIGESAFEDCSSLTSVTIPSSVTSIGDFAFWKCSSLTSVTIPEGVTSIGDYAFNRCYNLKIVYNNSSLDIVKGSEAHGYVAFYADIVFTITEGVYYMKNVGAGLFLTGGNAWGTQGTFSENGFDVTVTALPSGKYVIDTKVDNWGNHYLGADGFIDAPQAEWTIEPQPGGTYAITNDGVNYIGYDGSTTVLNLHLTNPSEDNARWKFMTYEEVMAEICTATKDNPKTVTMLLPGASFNQNDTRNVLWSGEPAVGGYQTEFASNKCGEKYNIPAFDVAQTLTNLPNGYYKI